jgi:hypothetical protein
MVSKFTKLLKELRALSHEERMERVRLLAEEWERRQRERRG